MQQSGEMGNRNDSRSSRGPNQDEQRRPDPAFERQEDMGGSHWSGASGRGGMSYDAREAYGGEHAYESQRAYGPPSSVAHEHHRGVAHVPGQRWSGGYGGDREPQPHDRDFSGRGFTSSDFGGTGTPPPTHYQDPRDNRGPHYGKGPKGYKRSDERTREEVCEAIAHQGHIDATDVDVTVKDGIVTLTGTVAQRHQKRGLEQLVEHCRGVEDVHNELRLQRAAPTPAEPALTDARRNGGTKNGNSSSGA